MAGVNVFLTHLIIENDGRLYPVEIKKTANQRREDISNFGALDKIPGVP